jgi:hypothetical protein
VAYARWSDSIYYAFWSSTTASRKVAASKMEETLECSISLTGSSSITYGELSKCGPSKGAKRMLDEMNYSATEEEYRELIGIVSKFIDDVKSALCTKYYKFDPLKEPT